MTIWDISELFYCISKSVNFHGSFYMTAGCCLSDLFVWFVFGFVWFVFIFFFFFGLFLGCFSVLSSLCVMVHDSEREIEEYSSLH